MEANFLTIILLIFLVFLSNKQTTLAKTSNKSYQNYIKSACNSTTYPNVCYKSLSSYGSTIKTNPYKLCNSALTVTLRAASNASASVSTIAKRKGLTPTETGIVKDCIENIGDSVDELKQSLKAMNNLGGGSSNVTYQMADIKTWVSAAITDEDTCMDGFAGKKVNATVKKQIRNIVLNLAKLTSNALSLINSLKY